MKLGETFRARIHSADFGPVLDDDADFVLLCLKVPKTMRIGSGLCEVTLVETGNPSDSDPDLADAREAIAEADRDGTEPWEDVKAELSPKDTDGKVTK